MRFLSAVAFLAAAFLTTGCGDLLSLHTLHLPQERVFDAALEGRWENDDDVLTVERAGDSYKVTLQSKQHPEESSKYEVYLVDLGGERFADILWTEAVGHMFLKTVVAGDQLRLTFLDSQWLRDRVPHEEADMDGGRKQAVLTARTGQLRDMVAKFAREPRAYDDHEQVYRRTLK